MHDVLRFWLDRGVDGFRLDAIAKIAKDPELRDNTGAARRHDEDWDTIHEHLRGIRRVVDEYEDRMIVGEVALSDLHRIVSYVKSGDQLHLAHNFVFCDLPWDADGFRISIDDFEALSERAAWPAWFLENHDHSRVATRFDDDGLGPARARAVLLLLYALRGTPFVYQGEELGLPEHTTLPDDARQDPTWFRHEGAVAGRDGCRVPIPWHADEPAHGFSPTGEAWLPQPESFSQYAADLQDGVEGSTLELYRTALELRRELGLGSGSLTWEQGYGEDVVAFRTDAAAAGVLVVANLGAEPVSLPEGAEVLLASNDLDEHGRVPTDVTVWAAVG
jgi:alpha-glucosidase